MSAMQEYLKPFLDKIPDEMKVFDQWVFWKGILLDKHDGKPIKVPYNTWGAAKSNKPITWMNFSYMASYAKRKMHGIAFMLCEKDSFSMIDIDRCVENGVLNEFAKKTMEFFDSYTELSPSGSGLRIIVKGKMTAPLKHPKKRDMILPIEIYSDRRQTSMTGHAVNDKPIADCQEKLERIYKRYKPKPRLISQNFNTKKNGTFEIPKEIFPQGTRNNNLAKWAGVIKNKVIDESLYWAYLSQVNQKCCDPPVSEIELHTVGQSIWRKRYAA
jgi:primase-polymerase (primpol)-like protein